MKYENEITVQVTCSYEELHNILIKQGFKIIEKYTIIDEYLINKFIDISNKNSLDILKECVIVRNIKNKEKELLYKYKEYNDLGDIVKQAKVICKINDVKEAINFMKTIGYKELIHIKNNSVVYTNGKTEFAVQLVNDKYIFIELEDKSEYLNRIYSSIDDMKKELSSYNIPIIKDNYFAKKAVIVLEENKKVNVKDYLGKEVEMKIDRPLGSRHPKHGFMYMLNYGFIPNTVSGDDQELDAYLLGEYEVVNEIKGKVIAIIHRTNDDDDKLIVSKDGKNYSDDAIRALTEFQEQYFDSIIIR
jgi:inorganic diphosphatase